MHGTVLNSADFAELNNQSRPGMACFANPLSDVRVPSLWPAAWWRISSQLRVSPTMLRSKQRIVAVTGSP
jgi:hypothetical protein